jgi:hypothetical protein
MIIYPVEFQRRLEQKWTRRIDQIIAVTGSATPPRDPNDDDDYEDEGANHLPPAPPSPPGKSSRPKKQAPGSVNHPDIQMSNVRKN